MASPSNPFATRFVQPGAIPYAFFDGQSIERLVERFHQEQHRGAIVGPHGVGKSTLLQRLVPRLGFLEKHVDFSRSDHEGGHEPRSNPASESPWESEPSDPIHWYRLSASSHRALAVFRESMRSRKSVLVVIDGFEQIPGLLRWWLALRSRWLHRRLLVTCHHPPIGLPVLYRARVGDASAEYVVRHLLQREPARAERLLASEQFAALRAQWGDNLRELLFKLYDLYEDGKI